MDLVCSVCKIINPNYKCPKCSAKYCSVTCYRKHKETPCVSNVQATKEDVSDVPNQQFITNNTVTLDKLRLLGESKELKNILHNEKLRSLLLEINNSETPAQSVKMAFNDPDFDRFAANCLNIIDPIVDRGSPSLDNAQTNDAEGIFEKLQELLGQQLNGT